MKTAQNKYRTANTCCLCAAVVCGVAVIVVINKTIRLKRKKIFVIHDKSEMRRSKKITFRMGGIKYPTLYANADNTHPVRGASLKREEVGRVFVCVCVLSTNYRVLPALNKSALTPY
jgi:type IV secretory pathway component VirB8